MNRPALIRLLLLKDLRYQRGLIALLWVLALLLPILARHFSPNPIGGNFLMIGPTGFFEFVCVVVLLRLILLDPPGRGIHFLATRPIHWTAVLTSKLLFAAAFLLIPNLIAALGAICAIGIHFSVLDLVLFLIEGTISAAALFAVFAAPALFLRTLSSVLMAIIGGALFVGIINIALTYYVVRNRFRLALNPDEVSFQLDHCRWLMFECGLALTGAALTLICYSRRPLRERLIVLGSGASISLLLWLYWPINLSVLFSDQPARVADLAPALRDKIQFHVWMPPGHPVDIMGSFSPDNILTQKVSVHGGLSGLEAPYFFTATGDDAEATFRSGRKLASSYKDGAAYEGSVLDIGSVGDNLRQQMLGFTPMWGWPRRWQDEGFEAFHYLPDRLRNEDLAGVSIRGAVTFTIGRAFILRTLPFRDGMVLNLPRRSYTIANVEAGPDRITFQILKQYMPLTLRGDLPGWRRWENLSWIVINRHKGEYLTDRSQESFGDYYEGHHLERPEMINGVAPAASSKKPIPADWINDAEIVFFSSEPCGRISFPYEIPSIDLIQ